MANQSYEALDTIAPLAQHETPSLRFGTRLVSLERPLVMGILNATPNSFYEASRSDGEEAIKGRLQTLVSEGADVIDIGACSTRPGSTPPSPDEETFRLLQALELARTYAPGVALSVDTYRSEVAQAAVEQYGIEIVNDVSAGELDPQMFHLVARTQVCYILMHMKGTPASMQVEPIYADVVDEVTQYLALRVAELHRLGVSNLIVDPGFGFGKTLEHNYALLRNLRVLREIGHPVLAGLSRKRMAQASLAGLTAETALPATVALNILALQEGASLLRVHDVAAAQQAVSVFVNFRKQPLW